MRHAVPHGCRALAVALLLAGAALNTRAAPSDGRASVAPPREQSLAGLRQDVWLLYSSSAALGPDARGRTVAEDIATWVLTDEVRRRLDGADQNDEAVIVEEPERRLTLIAFYWTRQFTLRHQRALWLQAMQAASVGEAQSSKARIDALENRLLRDFSPAMTLEALTGEINELTRTYDRERQRLVGLAGDARGAVFERSADLPCTRIVAQEVRASASHGLQHLWSPAVMDFYPMTARRDQLTGRVLLQIAADDTGCVQHIEVVRSSGAPELDAAAIDLVARSQFAPAVRDGKPVDTSARLPVVFKLDDDPSPDAKPPAAQAAPGAYPTAVPPLGVDAQTPAEHVRIGN